MCIVFVRHVRVAVVENNFHIYLSPQPAKKISIVPQRRCPVCVCRLSIVK
jgi:hypothetical protein